MPVEPEIVARLTEPLFAAGEAEVFLAECCGRVLVTVRWPSLTKCSRCGREIRVSVLTRPPEN